MTPYDVGLLILRVVLGLTLAAHGLNKFFGGGKIPGTARWFESIGMKPGKFHATVAASTETAAGVGLAAGLLTPIPAAGFVSLMLVAAWTVHRANGFFIVKEGWEYNLVLAASAIAVATLGPGKLSLDYLIFGARLLALRLDRFVAVARVGSRRGHRPVADLLPATGQTGSVTPQFSNSAGLNQADPPAPPVPPLPGSSPECTVPDWPVPPGPPAPLPPLPPPAPSPPLPPS